MRSVRCAGLLALLSGAPAVAADPAQPPAAGPARVPATVESTLTLAEAVSKATERSALLAAAGAHADSLNIGRATAGDGLELRLSERDISSASAPRAQAALRLQWQGLAVGAAERGVEAAAVSGLRAEQLSLREALSWSVERSFAQILLIEAEIARRDEAEAAWGAVAAGVARRAELGADTALDVVAAKVRAVEAVGRAADARAALMAEQARLRMMVGLDAAAPLRLAGPRPTPRPAPAGAPRAASTAADQAKAEAHVARALALPRLDFVQAGVEGGPSPGGQLALSIRLPVLDGSIGESKEQQATARAVAARADAVAAEAAAAADAEAVALMASLDAIQSQAALLAEARAALPAVQGAEALAQIELRARLAELEAALLSRERALWP